MNIRTCTRMKQRAYIRVYAWCYAHTTIHTCALARAHMRTIDWTHACAHMIAYTRVYSHDYLHHNRQIEIIWARARIRVLKPACIIAIIGIAKPAYHI